MISREGAEAVGVTPRTGSQEAGVSPSELSAERCGAATCDLRGEHPGHAPCGAPGSEPGPAPSLAPRPAPGLASGDPAGDAPGDAPRSAPTDVTGDGVGGMDEPASPSVPQVPERELQRRLLCFARRFLRDRTEAEDVMQETLLRARQSETRLRTPERAEAWLFRICRHAAIDHRRARRVRERVWHPLTEERAECAAAVPAAPAGHPSARVVRVLRSLPAHHRVLMSLHYERGLPQGAICQLTGLSTSALRVRLFRARGALSTRGGTGGTGGSSGHGVKRERLAGR